MNRNLAAAQFVDHVEKHGGATMDLASGRILPPGKRGFVVGGEPDKNGQRIPTKYVPQVDFNSKTVAQHMDHLASQTNGNGASLGAWSDNGNVELDASRVVDKAHVARKQGKLRGEKAVWNNHAMTETDTSSDKSDERVKKDLGQ